MPGGIFKQIYAATKPLAAVFYSHPLVSLIEQAKVPTWVFKHFIDRDLRYIRGVCPAMLSVAQRCTRPEHAQHFEQMAHDNREYHDFLYGKYLVNAKSIRFFSPLRVRRGGESEIAIYLEHSTWHARKSHPAVAAACFLPCYELYAELGRQMLSVDRNPYQPFIDGCSHPGFLASGKKLNEICVELAAESGDVVTIGGEMLESYVKSVKYEIAFLDAILKLHALNETSSIVRSLSPLS